MYVLSHGCLLSSYKAFSILHAWFFLSCVFTSSGCKCLLVVYAFFPWKASCYKSCLLSHDVAIYCMLDLADPYGRYYGLPFRSSTSHSSHYFSFWIIRVNLELSSLVLRNKSHPSFLVGDYVRDLSYKSNAFVWIETFHQEYSYWKIRMHKYMIMQLF